jgi:hypothetical protein
MSSALGKASPQRFRCPFRLTLMIQPLEALPAWIEAIKRWRARGG